MKAIAPTIPVLLLCLGASKFSAISGNVKRPDGVPTQRFRKEIVKVGTYYKDSDSQTYPVDMALMQNWVAQFAAMSGNGLKVTIPATHDISGNPDLNRGYVDDLFIDGDSLYMACTLIGEDAILAAARSDVSLYSPPEFVDGKANKYPRPITHVALVTNPVVPGLDAFVPISASLTRGVKMWEELVRMFATALGITEPVTEENAKALVAPAFNALVEKNKAAPATPPVAASAGATPEPTPSPAAAGTQPVKSVTTTYVASMSPAVVGMVAEARKVKISTLVHAGKITVAQGNALVEKYIGKDNAALSLALNSPTADDGFDATIALLDQNPAARSGERTPAQLPGGAASFSTRDDRKIDPSKVGPRGAMERRRQRAGLKD